MTKEHASVKLLKRLDLQDLAGSADLFAKDFVWHYVNPNLPDMEGDYEGIDGLHTFFERLGAETKGTFRISPISVTPYGDELLVVHVRNSMTREGRSFAIDAIVVWRVVNGRFAEAWDIPSAHVMANER